MAGDSVIYEELRAEGASVSGTETGGDFQASSVVNADLSSEASSTEQTSSSTSVIELFGIRLEDLEDEATGQVVEALVSGGDAILSSAVDAESSSSSSSVDGISETSSSFDVVGVGGTKVSTNHAINTACVCYGHTELAQSLPPAGVRFVFTPMNFHHVFVLRTAEL